ncbi:hypothetical protein ACE6H2_008827 [Prunus campanulata]
MATLNKLPLAVLKPLWYLITVFCYFKLCFAVNRKHLNLSTAATHWYPAGATWYGSPDGAGSDGGSCGYGNLVSQPPFSSMITGIGPSLYKSGKESGACYQEPAHFDLSGTAFGAMARPGQQEKLRDAGVLQIQFARVACDYSGKTIAFQVDQGSNSNYFAAVIEFEEGDGDLAGVELKEASSSDGGDEWRAMQQSWGAVWKLDAGAELHPPLSIRLTSQYSAQTLLAKDVIPVGWKPGATYRSLVNYL